MYKKLSRTDEILNKLKSEGKDRNMDTDDDILKISEMNKYMEEVRREFIVKSVKSEISASKVILNA
jgi:hypothetical protein